MNLGTLSICSLSRVIKVTEIGLIQTFKLHFCSFLDINSCHYTGLEFNPCSVKSSDSYESRETKNSSETLR